MAITPDFSVADKVVLITGGAGGIGGAFAQAFLNHGASVIITDVAAPRAGTDPRIRYEQLDVRDNAAIDTLASRIEKLNTVIHCAGRIARWEEYKVDVFQEIVDIHLVASLRLANAFRPHLKATKGCIINIASMYSYFGAPHAPAWINATNLQVALNLRNLYAHLMESRYIAPIVGFDPSIMDIFSRDVLAKIQRGETGWESAVPEKVAALIKERHLFGYQKPSAVELHPV
jgi:NAD(P)-dependent dehydrogenase (short-subunit alcohol dehydrogenase family)